VNNLPRVVTQPRPGWESNSRPLDRKYVSYGHSEDRCTEPHCLTHLVFAMNIVEQMKCSCCEKSEKNLNYTQLLFYVTAPLICSFSIEKTPAEFGQCLRNEHYICPCGREGGVVRSLLNTPCVQLPPQPLRGLLPILLLVNRGTMGVNSLPNTVTRQRRDCDMNSGPSAPESSTLTTRLPSHPYCYCSSHYFSYCYDDSHKVRITRMRGSAIRC